MTDGDQREFRRTLPMFTNHDRDVVQRLLHHAVSDYRYDHPDRKVARDLYHTIREGESIRLHVGWELTDKTLVLAPAETDTDPSAVVDRFVTDMQSADGEWPAVATDLQTWRDACRLDEETCLAFEYLH